MLKYKIGDELKITDRNYGHRLEINKIYSVLQVMEGNKTPYRMSTGISCWVGDDEVELVTDQPELEFETTFLITI